MKWALIIGGILVLFVLMRRQGGTSILGSGERKSSSGITFGDVKGFFSGLKNFFGGNDAPTLTGSELETSSGSIDLSKVYGE